MKFKQAPDTSAHGPAQGEPHQRLSAMLARVAAGDEAGMAALYDETSPTIYGLLTHMLGAGSAAEEALVEVYSCVWRQAASYRAGSVSPAAWLISTARECALRKTGTVAAADPPREASEQFGTASTGAGGAESSPSNAAGRRARAALRALGAEQREALRLSYFSGLRQVEAAFGLSTAEARSLVRDALKGYAKIFRGVVSNES